MESIVVTVGREGEHGVFVWNRVTAQKIVLPSWTQADAFATALGYQARGVLPSDAVSVAGCRVRRDGDREVVEATRQGQLTLFAVMPLPFALEIANLVKGNARLIETEENWEELVFDQAILDRSNLLPALGLVSDPWLLDEAGRTAAWDSRLRRYLPGGVKRQRKVSTPQVTKQQKGNLPCP